MKAIRGENDLHNQFNKEDLEKAEAIFVQEISSYIKYDLHRSDYRDAKNDIIQSIAKSLTDLRTSLTPKPRKEDWDVEKILGELVGYASLCWEPKPTGVFDSSKASKAVDEAVTAIRSLIEREGGSE